MSKCKYIQPINPHVRFGVELKEIYPPWYLHPSLKNLIYLAEINIRNHHSARFEVEQLLGKGCNGEGSVKQRLELKERMISGKNILDVDVAPGVPIWLIRHFLGLLPTPIFPPKCDEHYWYNFSIRWYDQFIESIKKRSAYLEEKDAVAFELSHLPGRNLTLLFELFEMIRFLSMKSMHDNVVDKHAALLLVRYFTPSLIVRPYRPGNLTRNDKKYVVFILFAVHFWPEIRIQIHDILTSSMNKNPDKFYYYPEIYDSKYSDNNIYLKDIGTQTESDFDSNLLLDLQFSSEQSSENNHNTETKNKYNHDKLEELMSINNNHTSQNDFRSSEFIQEENKMVSSTPKSKEEKKTMLLKNISSKNIDAYYESIKKNNCKFLKNISTQTDLPSKKEIVSQPVYPKFSVKINSRIKKRSPKKKPANSDIIILEIPRKNCSKNINVITYKKSKQKNLKINKNQAVGMKNKIKTRKTYEEIKPERTCSSVTYGWNIDSTISNSEFIYDSYVGSAYNETQTPTQTPFRTKRLFPSEIKQNFKPAITPSIDLHQKITKYGWTYNRPSSFTSNSFVEPEPYKLCYDSDQKSVKSLNSETPLTENVKKKKGYSSFMKISSRFLFFKKFTSGKQTAKKSVSCEDLNCSIKYEKMSKSANTI